MNRPLQLMIALMCVASTARAQWATCDSIAVWPCYTPSIWYAPASFDDHCYDCYGTLCGKYAGYGYVGEANYCGQCTPGTFCGDPNDPCDDSTCVGTDDYGPNKPRITTPRCEKRSKCGPRPEIDRCGGPTNRGDRKNSPDSVADPVSIVSDRAITVDKLVDFSISTPAGRVEFIRTYVSDSRAFLGESWRSLPPTPFGATAAIYQGVPATQQWNHNFYSYIDTHIEKDSGTRYWRVRTPNGDFVKFLSCVGADCWALPQTNLPAESRRLHFIADGGARFEFVEPDQVLTYGAPYSDGGWYFLSEVANGYGETVATVSYADPGLSCPSADAGVPYISAITLSTGVQLIPSWDLLPNPATSQWECVVTGVSALVGGIPAPLTSYTYAGGNSGLLATATTPSFSESYGYASGFSVSRNSSVIVAHAQDDAGNVTAAVDNTGTYGIGMLDAGTTCGVGMSCVNPYARHVAASVGGVTLTQRYSYDQTKNNWKSGIFELSEGCGGSYACSQGETKWLTRSAVDGGWGTQNNSGIFYVPGAVIDKRGNASTTQYQRVAGGTELRVQRSGVAVDGGLPAESTALESTSFAYSYNTKGQQAVSEDRRPSTLNPGNDAITTYVRDSANRVLREERSGWTLDLDGGLVSRTVKTFYTYDGNGRVTLADGPCETTSTSACPTGSPTTAYTYYPSGYYYDSGRVHTVTRGGALTVTYEEYTPLGDPSRVTDENGVVTTFTYVGRQVASRTVNGKTWGYNWDNERLVGIEKPDGNWELRCYRASGGTSCSGSWTGQLTSVLHAANSSGGGWTEMTQYTYAADGALATQVDSINNAGTPQVRRSQSFASDAHRRSAGAALGTAGDLTTRSGYDGANNRVASGSAFNTPPAWCRATGGSDGSSGALSRLCAHYGYDRANRLRQLDLYRDPTSATPTRACVDYDAQGHVSRVTTGCSGSDSCSYEASASTCGGSADYSHDYKTDDFGNVVEVKLSGTSNGAGGRGVFRYAFDARGNLVGETGEATPPRVHTYDALNRRLGSYEMWGGSPVTLAEFSYDSDGAAPPTGCASTANTAGRLRRAWDPYFTRWYQYDEEGRVVREIRAPTGASSCSTDFDLHLSYSNNGNLTSMRYSYGREVTYVYGSGGAADRVTKVSVNVFQGDGGTTTRDLVDQVTWEPWGELRGYRMKFPVTSNTASLEYEKGAASTAYASGCPVGAIGETNDESGRLRSIRLADGTTQLFRKTYAWSADQVKKMATCYRVGADGGAEFLEEDYSQGSGRGYDGMGQLLGVLNSPDAGGPFSEQRFEYDQRGSLMRKYVDATRSYVATRDAGSPSTATWLVKYSAGNWGGEGETNGVALTHDNAGRVIAMREVLTDFNGNPTSTYMDYSGDGGVGPGSGSVFRRVRVAQPSGAEANYTYWYDTKNRRQAKTYSLNNRVDLQLYDLGHQLLEELGNSSLVTPAPYPLDSYVWLGGRPIAVIRSQRSSVGVNAADDSGTCSRLGDGVACGTYFVVTDHIGKPVLTLDGSRRIAGVGEYEPSGYVNRRQLWWETVHPHTWHGFSNQVVATAVQRSFGMNVDYRFHFPMIDFAQCPADPLPNAWVSVGGISYSGGPLGNLWTDWSAGVAAGGLNTADVRYSDWNSTPTCLPLDYDLNMGAVLREYEYRRYEAGATPYLPPLRFPGHYWDPETDTFENWHRNYWPMAGQYLSPDPISFAPAKVLRGDGYLSSEYVYARNNSVHNTDSNGRTWCVGSVQCECERDPTSAGCTGVSPEFPGRPTPRPPPGPPEPPKPPEPDFGPLGLGKLICVLSSRLTGDCKEMIDRLYVNMLVAVDEMCFDKKENKFELRECAKELHQVQVFCDKVRECYVHMPDRYKQYCGFQ